MLTNILSYGAGTLIAIVLVAVLGYVFISDITQKKHGVLRNYPVVGHLRYFFEEIGEYFRQYYRALLRRAARAGAQREHVRISTRTPSSRRR